MNNPTRKSTPSTATTRLAAAQAAFDALAAARTASAVAAGIDPECDSRPQSAAMKRAAVALGFARAAAAAARRTA